MTGSVGDSDAIQAAIKNEDWNDYVVIAKGNHLQHFINGKLTVDVTDEVAAKAAKSGVFLPAEMVTGESEAAFYRVVQQEFPTQLSKALAAILSGTAPKGRLGRGRPVNS